MDDLNNSNNSSNSINNDNIFNIIKSNNCNKLQEFINNNIDFDYNIMNNGGVYLIHYCIFLNNIDMLKILLTTHINLDISDNEGKTILYMPIKLEYINIIELLLKNDNRIGLSICSMIDNNGLTALHYAIQFGQIKIFDLLINKTNLLLFDNNGNNFLQYAIHTYKNTQYFIENILKHTTNINYQNSEGKTAMHIACIGNNINVINLLLDTYFNSSSQLNTNVSNITNDVGEYGNTLNLDIQENITYCTVLHYMCLHNNLPIIKRLISLNVDVNIQDINGDTVFHYCVKEKKYDILYYLMTNKKIINIINLNQYNIYLNLPLHELFILANNSSVLFDKFHNYINILIDNTNLNFQNKYGNSCLIELCKFGIWKQYSDNLENKKLNILLKNNDGKVALDYIQDVDKDDFINIIVKSYIKFLNIKKNNLNVENVGININTEINTKNNPIKDIEWINTFDKNCLNDINKCKTDIKSSIINNTIKSTIPLYKKQKNQLKDFIESNYNQYTTVVFSTFVGLAIDVLCGLKYIELQHNNDNVRIVYNLNTFDNTICNFYERNNLNNYNTPECLFESSFMVWYNPILHYNTQIRNIIKESLADDNIEYIIIFLLLFNAPVCNKHANILLLNKNTNEVERYDPYGTNFAIPYNYKNLDKELIKYFKDIDETIIYISPEKYLSKIGLQQLDQIEYMHLGDPDGFCVAWCIWYVDLRITYININRTKIIKYIINMFNEKHMGYKNAIRNFSKEITDIRDNIFKEININLNDYINGEMDINKYTEILKILNEY